MWEATNLRTSCRIPLRLQKVSGHDFSRAEKAAKSCWAVATYGLINACFKNGLADDGYDPSGAKARRFLSDTYGTTKVVP
jgi:hypothetical protein